MAAHIFETRIEGIDGLQAVHNAMNNISFDRLLYAIQNKRRVTISDIEKMDADILRILAQFSDEYAKLEEASYTFNRRFVLRNNRIFSSAEAFLKTMDSSLSELRNIFIKFTPNNAASVPFLPDGYKKPSIYDRSTLGSAEYTPLLFSETVRPEVRKLYDHIVEFFKKMDDAIFLCQCVLEEEAEIKKDPKQCLSIYNEFKNDHYTHIQQMIKTLAAIWNSLEDITNPAILLRKKCLSEEEFSQNGFHNLLEEDVCMLATKEQVEEVIKGDYSHEELFLFGKDGEKIKRVRSIIQNFESFLLDKIRAGKLPSIAIAYLLVWSAPTEKKAFYKYFVRTYKDAGGKYGVPDYSAMCNSSYTITKNAKFAQYVEKFENFK